MECGKCLELLSDFIDGTINTADHSLLSTHLHECLPCGYVRSDIELIIKLARELREDFPFILPPTLKTGIFSSGFQRVATT